MLAVQIIRFPPKYIFVIGIMI
uniref:Uncharacterized protein n=1 Tax=Rhizophora mucronata TaxID=61149 RepID=A0A2P2M092_RHIMU